MRIYDARDGQIPKPPRLAAQTGDGSAARSVAAILDEVRTRGREAVLEYTASFDGVQLSELRVNPAEFRKAWDAAPEPFKAAVQESISRVRRAHRNQLPQPIDTDFGLNSRVSQHYLPVRRAGLYAPGGRAAYASSVIMNAVPAQVAEVPELVLVSPPNRDTGLPSAPVLAACHALGITEVYAIGGAQAIGALAYGLPTDSGGEALERVDLITGPGNMFVAEAKRQLQGSVGIDSVAGPTEVLVLADAFADPGHVAADLISQAEHDEAAAAVFVTPSAALADAVSAEVDRRLAATRNRERAGAALRGQQSYVLVTKDLDAAIDFANGYGAEHLEVITEHPREVAGRIRNAGAVFVGTWSPVSLGDYVAGSNHVLPTGGTCRHAAGLSVHTFLRPMQFIEYSEEDLRAVSAHVSAFAEAESLWAHGEAVEARFEATSETPPETPIEAPPGPRT